MLALRMIVGLLCHVTGDYVLQSMLYKHIPHKRANVWAMCLHSIYAEVLTGVAVGLFVSWQYACFGAVVLVASHFLIDSLLSTKHKTVVQSVCDQLLHTIAIALFVAFTN